MLSFSNFCDAFRRAIYCSFDRNTAFSPVNSGIGGLWAIFLFSNLLLFSSVLFVYTFFWIPLFPRAALYIRVAFFTFLCQGWAIKIFFEEMEVREIFGIICQPFCTRDGLSSRVSPNFCYILFSYLFMFSWSSLALSVVV